MNEPPENKNEEFDEDDLDFDESEFDFDDEFDDEFDEEFEELEKETPPTEEEQPEKEKEVAEAEEKEEVAEEEEEELPPKSAPKEPIAKTEQASEVFSADEIPLSISVEVGRLKMSIKKLMELEPGNMLELGIKPDQGIDLVVEGKCIARGELLKIGDTLGVRIIEK